MNEFKPCPFKHVSNNDYEVALIIFDGNSGSKRYEKDETLFDGGNIRVVCGMCGAKGPIAFDAQEAIKLWNVRENK